LGEKIYGLQEEREAGGREGTVREIEPKASLNTY
jgi:hypothetical protein